MIELRPDRKLALIGIYDGNGFQSVLDVFENLTIESENALIGEPPGDNIKVLALHAVAYAQRAMLTKAINQIDALVGEARGGQKKDTNKLRESTPGLGEED